MVICCAASPDLRSRPEAHQPGSCRWLSVPLAPAVVDSRRSPRLEVPRRASARPNQRRIPAIAGVTACRLLPKRWPRCAPEFALSRKRCWIS
jgi:hypothetical protein